MKFVLILFAYLSIGCAFTIGYAKDYEEKCHKEPSAFDQSVGIFLWAPGVAGVLLEGLFDSRPESKTIC